MNTDIIEESMREIKNIQPAHPLVYERIEQLFTTIYQRGSKEGAMKQNEMFVRHIDEIMKVTTNPHELVDWLVFYRNTINPNNYEHTSTTKQ